MRTWLTILLLLAAPALASAQVPADPGQLAPPPDAAPPPSAPPPPPAETPPPPMQASPLPSPASRGVGDPGTSPAPAPQQAPAAGPAGQWVTTSQYGTIWIPYDRQYVYVPPDPQLYPQQFVYYPVYGWRWVVAPWVYGYGPQPRWGPGGVVLFSWYAHPWFRVGGYWGWGAWHGWGPYRGWMGPRVWGARGWAAAPAYYRTGVGHRAPAFRPQGAERGHARGGHQRQAW